MKFPVYNRDKAGLERDNHGHYLSKEQTAFFKNSKVRDKNGRLLVCHHGTRFYGFDEFDSEHGMNFFTPVYAYAYAYMYDEAEEKSANVYRVYLNITNPINIGNVEIEVFKWDDDQYYWSVLRDILRGVDNDSLFTDEFRAFAKSLNETPLDLIRLTKEMDWDDNVLWCLTNSEGFANYVIGKGYDGIITSEYSREGGAVCYAIPSKYNYNIKLCSNRKPTNSKIISETLLTEGKNLEKTWEKYKDKFGGMRIPFTICIEKDPTYTDANKKAGTTGDYGEWIIRQFLLEGDAFFHLNIRGLLEEFIAKKSNLKNKDINYYKTVAELEKVLKEVQLSPRQEERRRRNANKDAELVFSGDKYDIYVPKTYEGSCTLGKGTDWCTAHSGERSFYDGYTAGNSNLYVLINKEDSTDKYQFSDLTGEFKDRWDEDCFFRELKDINSENFLKQQFITANGGGEELFAYADALHIPFGEFYGKWNDGWIYVYDNVETNRDLSDALKNTFKKFTPSDILISACELVESKFEGMGMLDSPLTPDYLWCDLHKLYQDGRLYGHVRLLVMPPAKINGQVVAYIDSDF